MYLLVGLGNPGSQYERTRHNIGFHILDVLAGQLSLNFTMAKWQALTAKGLWHGKQIMLAKPQTFMNLSGESVAAIINYFHIDLTDLIVIHDDLDLACGQLKLAYNRGHGGHNGLKSINTCLGSGKYNRLRFGIGRPQNKMPVDRFVLSRFAAEDEIEVDRSIPIAIEALEIFLREGMATAMQQIHSN